MCILGIVGFISLNIIVCLLREETFPFLKHLIMIIGYISIIIFAIGFFLLIKKGYESND